MSQPASTLDEAIPDVPGEKTWRVGTLVYNKKGLFNVFAWMLTADFCLNLMDSGVAPNLSLILLKKWGASSATIGFLTGTVVEFMSLVMVVIISTASDRTRSRLGRRMPWMLYATPPLAVFLALTGFAPEIAGWLGHAAPSLLGGLRERSAIIAVFSFFFLGYKFFDLFPQSVYWYLFADVIPQQVMGTFACLFRVFSTAGTMVFSFFMLAHVEDHPGAICVSAAVLYMVAFLLLCFRVKEGEYPPPEPRPTGPLLERWWHTVRRYVRESYSLRYYWTFYAFYLCFMCGFRPFNNFLLLYGKETLKMDLGTYGLVQTAISGLQIGVYFLIGPVIDRFHPLRAGLVGYVLMFITGLASYLFIQGPWSFTALSLLTFGSIAVFQGAFGALPPRLLPQQQYGQFCSANAMVWHLGLAILMPACGWLMDHYGNAMVFVWFFSFSAAGIAMMWLLYRQWKQLGGDEAYAPPVVVETNRRFDVLPAK